jgi:hypothetical protein
MMMLPLVDDRGNEEVIRDEITTGILALDVDTFNDRQRHNDDARNILE